ncbi:MAG: guanylate kinase, partial [Pyrinomonadaceae bacterium]
MSDSELKKTLTSNHVQRGMLVVVSSPSGGGKGTLIKEVLGTLPMIGYSVSFTTRSARDTEVNGRDYHFVTESEFEAMIEHGELLEWARVHGNLYGTGVREVKKETEQGRDIILEIDVQGAANIRALTQDSIQIFVMPPSFEVLRARLVGRGTENQSDLELRLRNSHAEVA